MNVAGLVLAAGAGSRMGTPKALVCLAGEPLPARVARLLTEGGCDPVTVVVGAEAARAREALPGLRVLEAPDWAEGLSASLRVGLVDATGPVLVALADQPDISAALVRRLVSVWHGSGADAVVAGFDGRARNPVLLSAAAAAEVAAAATGDSGARAWLRAHPDRVRVVECGDLGSEQDLDTPADLDLARARLVPQESR